jgi:gold/copper resistance efflux system membrane fusion protein
MNKRHWIAGSALIIAFSAGIYGLTAGEKANAAPAKQPAAPEVPVAEVVVRELAPSMVLTGAIVAIERVQLRARVSGFVESVALPEGGLVRAGQLLFQIDAQPFRVAVERARAELSRARAQSALADVRLQRGNKLVEGAVISANTHDALVAEAEQARAAVVAATATLREAELELSYTRVIAPIAGRIGESLVDGGNLVSGGNAGGTLLAEIVSMGPVQVEFDVDEPTYRRLLQAKQDVQGRIAGTSVAVALAGDEGFPHPAQLDFLSQVLDTASGTARARATAPNETGELAPGLFARVQLATDEARPTLLISDRAVGTDQQGRFVLLVNDQGVVEQRHIRVDATAAGLRIVAAGLEPGDRVVMGGMVRPGMQVRPRPISMINDSNPIAFRSVP